MVLSKHVSRHERAGAGGCHGGHMAVMASGQRFVPYSAIPRECHHVLRAYPRPHSTAISARARVERAKSGLRECLPLCPNG